MTAPTTLYRFKIELSDIDRGVYEALDFRAAMHPSETHQYLLTRVLAFALSFQPGLEFSSTGLSDPDQPGLSRKNPNGGFSLWIEIGNPSPRKLHKASKASDAVKVFTYKDANLLAKDLAGQEVHKRETIELYSLPTGFLDNLKGHLDRENRWSIVHQENVVSVGIGDLNIQGELKRHAL